MPDICIAHSPTDRRKPQQKAAFEATQSRNIILIDLLRGAAALLVVLFHTESVFLTTTGASPFSGLMSTGFRGVDLFFVISGFIIWHVHAADIDRPRRLFNYLFNRVTRIYPALWITSLLALTLYSAGFGGAEKQHKLAIENVVSSFVLLPPATIPLVNVTWTLSYEMLFYLAFASFIFSRRLGVLLLTLWGCGILFFWFYAPAHALLQFGFNPLFFEFAAGMLCAIALRHSRLDTYPRWAWTLLLSGVCGFGICLSGALDDALADVLSPLSVVPLICGLVTLDKPFAHKLPSGFAFLGRAAYSVYLIHYSVVTLTSATLNKFGLLEGYIAFSTVAVLGVAAGLVFHVYVDSPLQYIVRQKVKPILAPSPPRTMYQLNGPTYLPTLK
jgi:exopolysaccharide production protein ExoZ